MVGYMHPSYAESLCEFGIPRKLPHSGGSILIRHIPGFTDVDAMGCYPLFFCQDWCQLHSDLQNVDGELVSLAIVTDPFGKFDKRYLGDSFDSVIPFKEHFIVDLQLSTSDLVSAHHRYYARKAVKCLQVEECPEPIKCIDEWVALYTNLMSRHGLSGIKTFSRDAFARQLEIPGTVMFRVLHQHVTVAAQIWFVQGEVGYSHLTALSEAGYALRASYALYWFAMEYFLGKVRWLDLGAGAGTNNNANDGLSEFKRGWSSGTRTTYFCGRIFNRERYAEITKATYSTDTNYFPAYRKGEFG